MSIGLKDYFAAKAMQGLLANLAVESKEMASLQRKYWINKYGGDAKEGECIAKEAYLVAEYMMKEKSRLAKLEAERFDEMYNSKES